MQENFEASKDDGAFEAQYKKLLEEIQQIYDSAKEFHSKVCGRALRLCVLGTGGDSAAWELLHGSNCSS